MIPTRLSLGTAVAASLCLFLVPSAFAQKLPKFDQVPELIGTKPVALSRPIKVPGDNAIGEGSCCCPWWEGRMPDAMTPFFPNGANGPYTMQIAAPSGLDDQMKAYLAYINSVEPSITQISIVWTPIDLGTGAAPAVSGLPITAAPGQSMTWSLSGSTVTSMIPVFWSGSPFVVGSWVGYITELQHNGNQTTAFMKPECALNYRPWRAQGVYKLVNGQKNPTGEIQMETIGFKGAVIRSAPVTPGKTRPIQMRDLKIETKAGAAK